MSDKKETEQVKEMLLEKLSASPEEESEKWVGFDLDGTLAKYTEWKGIEHIGDPIRPMCDLIKKMHKEGKRVKIITARVAPATNNKGEEEEPSIVVNGKKKYASAFIQDWCAEHLGFVPEIVHEKDQLMVEMYDDRAKQVIPNKGILLEDKLEERK